MPLSRTSRVIIAVVSAFFAMALSMVAQVAPQTRQFGTQQTTINAIPPIFVTAPSYLAEYQPRSIAVGDFNGDGVPDIAVANENGLTFGTSSVSVFLGNGDGTFQTAANYPAGGVDPKSIVAADLNGDGRADLILLTPLPTGGNYMVSLLLANADGTFLPATNLSPKPNGVLGLALGDFNRDGKVDMAVIDETGVTVLSGNGDGSFLAASSYPLVGAESVVAGDLNGDGKMDLLVAGPFSNSVFLGKGDGTFQPVITNDGGAGSSMVLGDFNGDGKQDVIFAGSLSMEISLGNGDGTLQPGIWSPWPFYGSTIMVAGDFNNDGHLDLAVATDCAGASACASQSSSILLGNGNGTFQNPRTYAAGSAPGVSIAMADLNNDGNQDLAVVGFGDPGSASALLGNGDGTFRAPAVFAAGLGTLGGLTGDFNSDGNLDIAVTGGCESCGANGGGTSILLGKGDGTFVTAVSYPTQAAPVSIVKGDLNGDGIIDLVSVDACGNSPTCAVGSVSVLLGKGDGSFQPAIDYVVQYAPVGAAIGDFNGDGKLDLAVANSCTNRACNNKGSVSILFGNGDGTFQPALTHLSGRFAKAILTGDFNRDGKADLAVVSACSDKACSQGDIAIWLGRGNGSFREANYLTSTGPTYGLVGDLNGDGKEDLIIALSQCPPLSACPNGLVNVMLGNGNGTFQPPLSSPVGVDPLSLAVEDFNGDGNPDVLASSGGTLMLLLGNGSGSLQAPTNFVLPIGRNLLTGDFNNDGKPDVAMAGNGVAILLNTASNFRYASSISLSSASNPSYSGESTTFTADIQPRFQAGALGGRVVFNDGSVKLGTAFVSHGQATLAAPPLTVGTHQITAQYLGNSIYVPEVSASLTQKVIIAPTTTTLSSNANPSVHGQIVTFTAKVTSSGSSVPTGKVKFSDGLVSLGATTVNSGVATFTKSTLTVGSHSITATYEGDTSSAKSTSSVLTQIVN